MQSAVARNPKLRGPQSLQSGWYRYYAGFAEDFAREALRSASIEPGEWVLDPWAGTGTTVSSAASLGINARGYDLNPVMVLVAKARCLEPSEYASLRPLTSEIMKQANRAFECNPNDPLLAWLQPASTAAVRAIEAGVQKLLVDDKRYASVRDRGVGGVSDLAAFFYVAIFRTIRQLFHPFLTSNPTWVKRPKCSRFRLRPGIATVRDVFRSNIEVMLPCQTAQTKILGGPRRIIGVASSEKLPIRDESIGCVLTSPPYCTRIDYAVATSPELALLGYAPGSDFDRLRRQLIGTSTVPDKTPVLPKHLGALCLAFMDRLRRHSSKASSTYYYKNHAQYFLSMAASLSEIRRVLKVGGRCILVVQDSYYKDLHNDLPAIITQMAGIRGLRLSKRTDFGLGRTLAGINPGAREYRKSFSAVESVLELQAQTTCRAAL